MAFDENAFMIAGVVFAMAGFGLYVWDTRGSKLFKSNSLTPANPVSVSSNESGSGVGSGVGGSKRRRIKQKNTRKRNYKN
jgi:hypothetical protein